MLFSKLVKSSLLDLALVKRTYYFQMSPETKPEQLVEEWITYRPRLSSIPNQETKKIDVAKEIYILDVAQTETYEFGNALGWESEASQQLELGDVAFPLLLTGIIRKHGLIDVPIGTENISDPKIIDFISVNLTKAKDTLQNEAITKSNQKSLQKNLSYPIQALKAFSEKKGWSFNQIIKDVYAKNTSNYIYYYFGYGSPFQDTHESINFLRLMRDNDRISDILFEITVGLKKNDLWFISGHKDSNIIRTITKNELRRIINSNDPKYKSYQQTAEGLLRKADFSAV